MSLYQEVQTILERAKLEKELIERVKKSASQGNTECTFTEVPEDLVKELFPHPFRVECVGGSGILVDWSPVRTEIKTTNMSGDVYWVHPETGLFHRAGGLPAVEGVDGYKAWWVNGELHRDGGLPAVEHGNGYNQWYVNGELHRDGGLPALELVNGDKAWYVNGKKHRDGGLPALERVNGYKEWWVNGELHRDGGLPAIEHVNGDKEWWVNGELHRNNGVPAVEASYGYKRKIHTLKM